MARIDNLSNFLTDVAEAIRTKKGSEDPIAAADFDTEIENLPSGGTPQQRVWTRPSDWWDTETILSEAENRKDNSNYTVYPLYIVLFDDSEKTTTFSQSTNNKSYYGDGYLTSDGVWYGTNSATHTWDETKDKPCSEGYKTRYVIVYGKSKTFTEYVNLRDVPCLEVIFGTMNVSPSFGASNYPKNSRIKNVVATDNTQITSIGNYAFNGCNSLLNVSIPSATSIGEHAFEYCSSLISASLPSATSIGDNAFTSCSSLSSVSFPNVTTLGTGVFFYCSSLISVSLPNVTSITGSTFHDCHSLSSVSSPSVTSIMPNAFYDCHSLQSISLQNVSSIGDSAFYNCYSLVSVSLPSVTSIGGTVFNSCYSLLNISFPSVTSIGDRAFSSCYALSSITLPNTITSIPTSTTSFSYYLKAIIIPDNFALNINLTGETGLTRSALINIIGKLKDLTGTDETHTITLGTYNTGKLTSDEIQVATDKGWTVS